MNKPYPYLSEELETRKIKKVILSKKLSQLGDFLTNYVYSLMKIGLKGERGAVHVWDKSLATAAKNSGLKKYFPSRIRTDGLADGVEALIAFIYLKGIMSLNEMVDILNQGVRNGDFVNSIKEKRACEKSFELLINEIISRAREIFNEKTMVH